MPARREPERLTIAPSPAWRVAVCVASGPSLSDEQVATIAAARAADRCRVIVVNDNYRRLPQADALYAGDGKWYRHHADEIERTFAGELWTADANASVELGLCWIKCRGKAGLSRDPSLIHGGGNSGYAAIGLARHFGARRIVLAGYDMSRGPNGEQHWFGEHPKEFGASTDPRTWVSRFGQLAADLAADGVDVINATARTALTCFRRGELAECLGAPCGLSQAAPDSGAGISDGAHSVLHSIYPNRLALAGPAIRVPISPAGE